jgi:hypothetical protein
MLHVCLRVLQLCYVNVAFFIEAFECFDQHETYVTAGFINTPSFSFYKARTQIKIQTLRSLTNNLRINFLFL